MTKAGVIADFVEINNRSEKKEALSIYHRRIEEAFLHDGLGESWSASQLQELKDVVEVLSGGSNTVIADDRGFPSVMVRLDPVFNRDLLKEGSACLHPAFCGEDSKKSSIYISKYQNTLIHGRPYSLPRKLPACKVTYNQAYALCENKGRGWHLSPFSVRALLALRAKKEQCFPHGNSNGGVDYFFPEEHGTVAQDAVCLTGSGPATWSHNHRWDGIFDLAGNLNEWDSGLRLVDGQIQVMQRPSDSEMKSGEEEEGCWRAISGEGRLVDPKTPGTFHYSADREGKILLTLEKIREDRVANCAFQEIHAAEGIRVPELLYALALYPEEADGRYDGWRWIRTKGEYFPLSGGAYKVLDHAGIFFTGMTYPRTHLYELSGFRSIYVSKE